MASLLYVETRASNDGELMALMVFQIECVEPLMTHVVFGTLPVEDPTLHNYALTPRWTCDKKTPRALPWLWALGCKLQAGFRTPWREARRWLDPSLAGSPDVSQMEIRGLFDVSRAFHVSTARLNSSVLASINSFASLYLRSSFKGLFCKSKSRDLPAEPWPRKLNL